MRSYRKMTVRKIMKGMKMSNTKEKLRDEMLTETRLRSEFEYFLDYYNVNEDMTLKELKEVVDKAQDLDWAINLCELIDLID